MPTVGQSLSIYMGAIMVTTVASGVALAEISVKRARDGAIVSMANLSPAKDCSPMVLRGRVSNLTFEQGELHGYTLSQKGGEQYINVPALYYFPDPRQKAIARDGYASLIRDGRNVKIRALFCGAAGRIVKMDAISTK